MCVIALIGFIQNSSAVESTSVTTAPEKITVGMYPMEFMSLAPHDGNLKMSFYVWYRTKNPDFKSDSVELLNSPDAQITNTTTGKNGDEYFTTLHYQATIDHDWNYKYFPFDHQIFKVYFEASNPIDLVTLIPDYKQSLANPNISMPSWIKITPIRIKSESITYNTNFGDNSSSATTYSRVTFFYEFKHKGWRLYINLFGAFFLCALFCIITCFYEDPDIRIQLILAGVIGFIGNKYILDTTVPEIAGFTLADAIQVATLLTMVFALSGLLFEKLLPKHHDKSKKISIALACVTAICYVSYISYYTILAINS